MLVSNFLITGANRGLGHETARRLLELGHDVWIGARDRERGENAAASIGARFVQLDVTDDGSVRAAAAAVQAGGGLDGLINNAGVPGRYDLGVADVDAAEVEAVYAVNVLGPVRTVHAFLPQLRAAPCGVIVNVSSGLGSHEVTANLGRTESSIQAPAYTSSKAALNMLTVQWAAAFPELRVNVVDPGYTATEFNGNTGPQTLQEGTDQIIAMATIGSDGPTGTFTDRHGRVGW